MLRVRQYDDWIAIYKDDKLIFQDHSIGMYQFTYILGEKFGMDVEFRIIKPTKDSVFKRDLDAGLVTWEDLDAYVSVWCEEDLQCELPAFLGLTEEEYEAWLVRTEE